LFFFVDLFIFFAAVVSKLFNIVQPTKAYFGQKDGIQCIVIKKMVKDLNFPVDVVIGPTLREADGLAMSSRNTYLTKEERPISIVLYRSLQVLKQHYDAGERRVKVLVELAKAELAKEPSVRLDYINICDLETGKDLTDVVGENGAMASGAMFIGKRPTRLIDNIILHPK
jgi:pantoate--beta-alanine ligase